MQEILEEIREVQRQFYCEDGAQRRAECQVRDDIPGVFNFDRPLAVTVELGPEFYLSNAGNDEYLAAFVFWMERVLGCRQVATGQVFVPETFAELQGHCRFNGHGLFDAWILKMNSVADDKEAEAIRRIKDVFSQPKQSFRRGTQFPTTLADVAGAVKPVVIEYGFPAYLQGSMRVEKQQRALQDVWFGEGQSNATNTTAGLGLKDSWKNGYCIKGGAIDEWVDVWSADQQIKRCEHVSKSKFAHSSCGPNTDAGQLAVAYHGLAGQFNTLGVHCIDKRFQSGSSSFSFLSDAELLVIRREVAGKGYQSPDSCGYVLMKRGFATMAFYAAVVIFLVVGFASLCGLFCTCKCTRKKEQQIDEEKIKREACYNLEQLMQAGGSRKILEDISAVPYGKLLASKVAEALEDESLEVPVKYDHLRGYSGWGIAKVNGTFSYHRLQYHGRGRGSIVQTWESSESFIRWLQEQSDRQMAVYGFTDNEMRRNDLIGNKTVTRKYLLELLDAKGYFHDVEDVTATAEGKFQASGQVVNFEVDLTYKANPLFLSGVAEESQAPTGEEDDMERWLSRTKSDMGKFLALLANSHLQVQADRLKRQIEHEAQAVLADDQRCKQPAGTEVAARQRACYNVWRRVLEGYHAWQGIHGPAWPEVYDDQQCSRYFAECLMSRFLESMAEHLVHAPEWLACVSHKVLGTLERSTAADDGMPLFRCKVDYADLCEPLEIFCKNSNIFAPKQGVNFDDINDCGVVSPEGPVSDVKKTWKEPVGLWVFFNFVVNYKWVLTVIIWLLYLAFLLYDNETFQDWTGASRVEPTMTRVTPFSLLILDAVWLGFLILCELFVGDAPTIANIGKPWRNRCLKLVRTGRIIFIFAMALVWVWMAWPSSVREVYVQLGQDDSVFDSLPSGLGERLWYLPFVYLALRFFYGCLPRLGSCCSEAPNWRRLAIFWVVFAGLCFLANYFMLVSLVRSLTPFQLCKLEDHREDFCATHTMEVQSLKVPVKDARCVACVATVVTSWSMVCLSSLLMMYFIFNVFVAILGSSVGAARGFVETSIASLDFRVEHVTSDFAEMRKAEAGWMTHGSILYALFGKQWRSVWEMMVDGLYEECLIDSQMRKTLVSEATRGGSVKLTGKDKAILHRARARLGYLFTSLRAILSDKNINFRPYISSLKDSEASCDALGVTHPGRLPSLTQIVPVYSEEGIMDMKELVGEPKQGAISTMLEFLISQLPEEWQIFARNEDVHPTELYEKLCKKDCSKEQQNRVREWASHRSQSVIRTINGAVHYHKALQLLLQRGKDVGFEEIRNHVQLIMAHQTYGKLNIGKPMNVKIQHGVLMTQGPHGLLPNDKVRLTLDTLDDGGAAAQSAAKLLGQSRAMAKLRRRAQLEGQTKDSDGLQSTEGAPTDASRPPMQRVLTDASQEEALVQPVQSMVSTSSETEPSAEALKSLVAFAGDLLPLTEADESTADAPSGTPSPSAAIRHPALLGRLFGQSAPKGLNFRSGHFYTVKEVLDDQTAILSDDTVNCGTARLEKAEVARRDDDVHYMLQKHKGYPFFIAIDFQRGKTHPCLEELIDEHLSKQASSCPAHRADWGSFRFKYASVLIRYSENASKAWPIEIVHVLPRARGLLIGSQGNLSQGKAGNQLGALRFAEGHFLQAKMMDAKMGCYSGETFKVPIVLVGFRKRSAENRESNHRIKL
eukprot:TRINITY_DN10030_c0_g1_i2.p1 TRINITY_DN10030_c0_g1~~TRINITY_DN10030_c0_g1_i2.p1  ORF type:complete len:1959 (+),score=367.55 TRINITY_DN10030_c0_g1_i2:810-5879(+)